MTMFSPDRGRALIVGLAVASMFLFVGCPRAPIPAARPYPVPTVQELTSVLAARQTAVSAMNARVRATSWLGGDRVRATVMMLVDRPGRLRFEAEVSLQGTVAVLATDGKQFAFLDTTHNEWRHGPACPANVASLIRIPLGPADVAAILLGDVRAPSTDGESVDWDVARGADVLAVRRNDGWLRVLFQPSAGAGPTARPDRLVGAIATGPDGRARWRVAFEDFTAVPLGTNTEARIALPQTIRFAEGDASFDEGVEIKVKERTLNEVPADTAFALPAPAGATAFEVGCPPAAARP